MDRQLVITVIAQDRPGLVESLAALVAQHDGNWLESRMSRLGGQFAGILRVRVPAARKVALISALEDLANAGIRTQVQPDEPAAPADGSRLAEFQLTGQDRPGIVRQISEVFARYGVNVEELTTECRSAPMSGEVLFHVEAQVRIPAECPLAQMKAGLERIASDLMVDATLKEIG